MSKTNTPYPLQFRQRLVNLIKSGRTPKDLASEFGCCDSSIRRWVRQDASSINPKDKEELRQLRREKKRWMLEQNILLKTTSLVCREQRSDVHRIYQFIKANQPNINVHAMCKTLQISKSGFYDWAKRVPCKRTITNAALTEKIKAIHTMSDGTYGMPRIKAELGSTGERVNKKRIVRLMRLAKLRGVSRRRSYIVTTMRDKTHIAAPDLVKRKFTASQSNQLWVADMTYIPTWEGFLYLSIILDVFSRKVVGWEFGDRMTSELVVSALNMAITQRKPASVIHHSDQGSQYTSIAFGQCCAEMSVRTSMGAVGDAYDNAMAESFFATLECELIARRSWKTKTEAHLAVHVWIHAWYNLCRRHSALGYESPTQFEAHSKKPIKRI